MRRRLFDSRIKIFLVAATLIMVVLRFLLNEKGRVTPDSLRFMRTANVFPEIDNTTTPLGYPLSLKFFTLFDLDEFWSSKIVGILSYLFIVFFARSKKFYFKETVLIGGLFSFVSLFSYTASEALMLPAIFLFLYVARNTMLEIYTLRKSIIYLSAMLILLVNIRYSGVFFVGGILIYGLMFHKKLYGKAFIVAALTGFAFVILYKFLFIDRFNQDYVQNALVIGLKSTPQLLIELFTGLTTVFNPFIHISKPGSIYLNIFIFAIGLFNIVMMISAFKKGLSHTEKLIVFLGIFGISCTFFMQYFYAMDTLDYRLLAPFTFPVWMVWFKKLYQILGKYTYLITIMSLLSGLIFTALSHGNYLQNRKQITTFLENENLKKQPLKFFVSEEKYSDEIQLAELISTVNSNITVTRKPEDTLQKSTITSHKILEKITVDRNKFQ